MFVNYSVVCNSLILDNNHSVLSCWWCNGFSVQHAVWRGIFAWMAVSVVEGEKMPEIESPLIVKLLRGTDLAQ